MAFCNKCGTQIADGVKFCPTCGNNVSGTPNAQQTNMNHVNISKENMNQGNMNQGNMYQQPNYQNNNGGMGGSSAPAFMNTLDTTAQYHPQDIASNKVFAILAYLGLLWLVPFFAAKQSPFAKYHVKQGFLIVCSQIGFEIIAGILCAIIKVPVKTWGYTVGYATPVVLLAILWIPRLAIWIVGIFGIINAAQGKAKELPFIGKIASKLTFLN